MSLCLYIYVVHFLNCIDFLISFNLYLYIHHFNTMCCLTQELYPLSLGLYLLLQQYAVYAWGYIHLSNTLRWMSLSFSTIQHFVPLIS